MTLERCINFLPQDIPDIFSVGVELRPTENNANNLDVGRIMSIPRRNIIRGDDTQSIQIQDVPEQRRGRTAPQEYRLQPLDLELGTGKENQDIPGTEK